MQFLRKFIAPLAVLLAASSSLIEQVAAAYTAKQLFQFPNAPFTDIENIAIRPNGQLILTVLTTPTIYTLGPHASEPTATLIHTFQGATSCLGITKIADDEYAVAVGNVSTRKYMGVQGTFAIWRVDMTGTAPAFTKIADIPHAHILNGMTHLTNNLAIESPALNRTAEFPLGVNGIHASGNFLYYTNSAQGTYGKIPIGPKGRATGPATVISHDVPGSHYDDFALDAQDNAYITNHPYALTEVAAVGTQSTILNATTFVQPTSAVMGLDGKKIYIVTAGQSAANGQGGSQAISGQVYVLTP